MITTPAATRQGVITALLSQLSPRQNLAAGGFSLIATVAAYIFMTWHGDDTTGLVVLSTPVITTFLQHGGLKQVTAEQSTQLVAAVEATVEQVVTHPAFTSAVREAITSEVPALIHQVLNDRAAGATGVPAQREPAAVA